MTTAVEYENLAESTSQTLDLFFRDVRRYPLLTAAEEIELAKRIEKGDMEAKERMINSNLRLVVHQARRHQASDLTLLDLIQEGVLGLIRATEKFDWRKGYKFSTYATFWIRQAMQRGIANSALTIRLPVHIGQIERRMAAAESRLTRELGRPPSDEELSSAADVSPSEMERVRHAARAVTSLDRSIGEEGETNLGEIIPDERPLPEEELEIDLHREVLQRAVEQLPEAERNVIRLRFGLESGAPATIPQIAEVINLPAPQVRQIERRGLARLATERELQALRDAA